MIEALFDTTLPFIHDWIVTGISDVVGSAGAGSEVTAPSATRTHTHTYICVSVCFKSFICALYLHLLRATGKKTTSKKNEKETFSCNASLPSCSSNFLHAHINFLYHILKI